VIPCGDGGNFDHLKKLGSSNNLISWLSGFEMISSNPYRGWSAERAMEAWQRLTSEADGTR
jgi:hypothetical protein